MPLAEIVGLAGALFELRVVVCTTEPAHYLRWSNFTAYCLGVANENKHNSHGDEEITKLILPYHHCAVAFLG